MEGDQQEQIPQNNQEAGTANENQPIPSDAARGSGGNEHAPQPNPPAQEMKSLESVPFGFHFLPKDWELIIHYLNRKIRGEPLPLQNFIQHAKLYKSDAEELTRAHPAHATERNFTPRLERGTGHGKREADKYGHLIRYKRPLGDTSDTSIPDLDLSLPSVGCTSGIHSGVKKRQLVQAPQPIVPQAACLPHPMKVLRQQSVTGPPGSLQPDHGSHEAETNQEKANDVGSSSLPPSDPRGTE